MGNRERHCKRRKWRIVISRWENIIGALLEAGWDQMVLVNLGGVGQ